MFRCNRVAYYLTHPNDNKNLIVRHTCNNSSCCNPNHLILGSYKQNKQDCIDSGNCSGQKLTWKHVKDIRDKFCQNPNICQHELTDWVNSKFNIQCKPNHLINICVNKRWKDNTYIFPQRNDQRGGLIETNTVNFELIKNIRKTFAEDPNICRHMLVKLINNKYNIKFNHQHLIEICLNKRWVDKNYHPPVRENHTGKGKKDVNGRFIK